MLVLVHLKSYYKNMYIIALLCFLTCFYLSEELLSLATKDSHFIFDGALDEQIDGVAVGSPLGPTLANAFLV